MNLFGLSGLVNAGGKIVNSVFGNKSMREQYAHSEQMSVYNQFAAEYQYRGRRTWWDSLWDGINRMPRPLMTFGIVWMFYWCIDDPVNFTKAMTTLQIVPEQLWWIFYAVIGFWFGTKALEKMPRKFGKPDYGQLKEVQQELSELEKEDRFLEEMADSTRPLSNEAILEWNRRNDNASGNT